MVRLRKPSGAAEVLEPTVDRLRRAVAGAGPVEEREHVGGASLQRPPEPANLGQHHGDAAADGVDHGSHHLLALVLVGFTVVHDDAPVDTPGRFDLDMLLGCEHRVEPGGLLLGEAPQVSCRSYAGCGSRLRAA